MALAGVAACLVIAGVLGYRNLWIPGSGTVEQHMAAARPDSGAGRRGASQGSPGNSSLNRETQTGLCERCPQSPRSRGAGIEARFRCQGEACTGRARAPLLRLPGPGDPVRRTYRADADAVERRHPADAYRHQEICPGARVAPEREPGFSDRQLGLDGRAGQAAAAEELVGAADGGAGAGRQGGHRHLCRIRRHGASPDPGSRTRQRRRRAGASRRRRVDGGGGGDPAGLSARPAALRPRAASTG